MLGIEFLSSVWGFCCWIWYRVTVTQIHVWHVTQISRPPKSTPPKKQFVGWIMILPKSNINLSKNNFSPPSSSTSFPTYIKETSYFVFLKALTKNPVVELGRYVASLLTGSSDVARIAKDKSHDPSSKSTADRSPLVGGWFVSQTFGTQSSSGFHGCIPIHVSWVNQNYVFFWVCVCSYTYTVTYT